MNSPVNNIVDITNGHDEILDELPLDDLPVQTNKKPKKPYVTKEQKEEFIQWYLRKYGYNVNLKINNSRVVSEQYERETGITIPKVTIFRWLGKLEQKEVKKFSSEYIVEGLG